jgi:hypothetical protein
MRRLRLCPPTASHAPQARHICYDAFRQHGPRRIPHRQASHVLAVSLGVGDAVFKCAHTGARSVRPGPELSALQRLVAIGLGTVASASLEGRGRVSQLRGQPLPDHAF